MNKKKLTSAGLTILMTLLIGCLSACGNQTNSVTPTYSTQLPLTVSEYTAFINKEIEPATNQLITQLMMAKNVADGTCSVVDAKASVKSSVSIVQECISVVDVTQPPKDYVETRITVIEALRSAEAILQEYADVLETETYDAKELETIRKTMQTQYIALTSLFNANWK